MPPYIAQVCLEQMHEVTQVLVLVRIAVIVSHDFCSPIPLNPLLSLFQISIQKNQSYVYNIEEMLRY